MWHWHLSSAYWQDIQATSLNEKKVCELYRLIIAHQPQALIQPEQPGLEELTGSIDLKTSLQRPSGSLFEIRSFNMCNELRIEIEKCRYL